MIINGLETFNCTGEDKKLFLNAKAYKNRSGKYILQGFENEKYIQLEQHTRLHAFFNLEETATKGLFTETVSFAGMTNDLASADIIIVSSIFSYYLRQAFNSGEYAFDYMLFLDRIYRPVVAYDHTGKNKVGWIGFSKVFLPMDPASALTC